MSPTLLITQPTRVRRLFLLVLAIDLVVFLALFATYIYLRVHAPFWPKAFHFPSGLMTASMTLFALAASFVMVVALHFHEKQDWLLASRMVALAIACWFTYGVLAAMEWLRLIIVDHVWLSGNPWGLPQFGQTYFSLTAFQFLHVFAGTFYLALVASRIRRHDLAMTAMFVHFTNAMWLVLFPALVLSAIDLQGL
jgi:heme/copper-type cytochrome/quinol oxidase subunit 3